jgi:hypothetical protein
MNDALRDAFVIEVHDLFPKHEIFEKNGASLADFQRILIVGDGNTLVCRQLRSVAGDGLVKFPSVADSRFHPRRMVLCRFL